MDSEHDALHDFLQSHDSGSNTSRPTSIPGNLNYRFFLYFRGKKKKKRL